MITIVFESHATTLDNERKIASGHYDVDLSPKGIENAEDLGKRRMDEPFAVIFTSDLRRSYKTAEIAFGKKFPIIQDKRLRECDYGEWEHRPSAEIEANRSNFLEYPFPGGESYWQCMERIKVFLQDLQQNHAGERVLVIGHRATQYGIDHWTTGRPLEEMVKAEWKWQPGWTYYLDGDTKLS